MAAPRQADLRAQWQAWGLTPKSQGERGTCSIFAVTGLLEYELSRTAGSGGPRLSEEFVNWASHQANGRGTDGSFFSDAIDGLQISGACTAALLPYAATFDAQLKPSAEALADAAARRGVYSYWIKLWDVKTGMTEAMLARVRQCLDQGHPVALGMRWPNKEQYDAGHVLAVPPADQVFDGHSVILVGYRDDDQLPGGGAFCFRNSSGAGWHDQGHAWLPYAYLSAYGNDAVGLRPAVSLADDGPATAWADLPVTSRRGARNGPDAITRYAVTVPDDDLYELSVWATREPDAGLARITANALTLQAALDLYAAKSAPTGRIVLGVLPLKAGANTLTVRCRGKSEGSGGYRLPLDKLAVRRVE